MIQRATIVSILVLVGGAFVARAFCPPRTTRIRGRPQLLPLTTWRCLHETSTEEPEKPRELSVDKVADMAECSFVNACLQLSKGYVDVLKLFIVAVKAGYELGMDPADLIRRVDSRPHQSAGRDLMAEEVKLRNTWIHVVYLVLQFLHHAKKTDTSTAADIDTKVRETYSEDLLADMKKQHEAGETFHLEHWLDKYSFPNMDDATENAIATQSLRVVWFTYTVLEEERVCKEEKSGLKAQPSIPGAFD